MRALKFFCIVTKECNVEGTAEGKLTFEITKVDNIAEHFKAHLKISGRWWWW
jgi:hypothetical protein